MNTAAMVERGIWAPRALVLQPDGGPFNHVLISTASHLSIPDPDDLQSMLGLSSMDMVLKHREDVCAALAEEHAALQFSPDRMLISNEHIHSRLRSVADLEQVKALLQPYCSKFQVVVYIRHQADMAQSIAATAVMNGATEFRPIPDFSAANGFDPVIGVDREYFDHNALLARLESVFGAEALDVRLYDADEILDADIISDFFGRLHIDIAGLPRPMRENTSLTSEATSFLATLNKYLPSHDRADAIRERFLAALAIVCKGKSNAPPEPQILNFMALFEETNEAVSARWFPERQKLFCEKPLNSAETTLADSSPESADFNVFIKLFDHTVK
jgi:hypothetical protein